MVGHKVKFVDIGAPAFLAHGYTRSTYDIDNFYEPSINNIKRLLKALIDFGYYELEDLKMEDLTKKKTLFRLLMIL